MKAKDKLTPDKYAKERRKGEYIALIIGLVFFGVLIYFIETNRNSKDSDLEERGVTTVGVITNITYRKGSGASFDFSVNGIVHHGHDKNRNKWRDALFIGNTYKIIYDPINPDNANLFLDDNGMPIGIDKNGYEIHYPSWEEPFWSVVVGFVLFAFAVVYLWKK